MDTMQLEIVQTVAIAHVLCTVKFKTFGTSLVSFITLGFLHNEGRMFSLVFVYTIARFEGKNCYFDQRACDARSHFCLGELVHGKLRQYCTSVGVID